MKTIYWSYWLYNSNEELLYAGYTSAYHNDLQMTFKHYAKRKMFWNEVVKIVVTKMDEEQFYKRTNILGKYNSK
jgi:hypothetical protein